MICITDKSQCVGCWACVQRCPKHCISMKEDAEGFLYPVVDENLCIDCGLCEKVCPVINQAEPRLPLHTYAAINPDEDVRLKSSSGGVFALLAEKVIDEGGVVFGAKFDEKWNVVHSFTETKEGVKAFRGSKYVQSIIGDSYKQAEILLKAERKVLFSGTPCQIAGLKRFLRKEYDNLLTVDFICHGVPSPGVWQRYLKEECARQCAAEKNKVLSAVNTNNFCIKSINFRDKSNGWKNYNFTFSYVDTSDTEKKLLTFSEAASNNLYMKGFLRDFYLRPSCYSCPAKELKSGSDITIGDFWGIQVVKPEIDDNIGVGVITLNTNKGVLISEDLQLNTYESEFATIAKYNPSLIRPTTEPNNRRQFFQSLESSTLLETISKFTAPTLKQRIRASLPIRALVWLLRKNKK